MLLKNNKKMILEKVINKTLTIEECILSNEYYVTYVDIYLLSKEYDLPIILLCNTIIDKTITNENFIIFNLNRLSKDYFFIKNRTLYDRKKIHNYKLIINSTSVVFNIDEDLQYSSDDLQSKLQNAIENFKDVLGDYINNYSLHGKKIKQKEQPLAKEEQPPAKEEQPLAKEEQPLAKEEQPLAKEEQPVAKEEQPPAKEEQPLAKEEQPLAKEEQPLAKEEQTSKTKKSKRCPNGTRKNKKTGLCEKI